MATTAANSESQLAWEGRQRPRAGIAALVGAIFSLGADLATSSAFGGAPHANVVSALRTAAQPGAVGSSPSSRTGFFAFYADNQSTLILGSIGRAIGYVAIGWALTFLAAAVRARRAELPRAAVYVALVGAVLQAISVVMGTVGSAVGVNHFLDGPRTVDAASDVTGGSLIVTAGFIGLAGSLALAAGFLLIALNGMRAGLLTRFMGVLGMITGVLIIIPIGPLPVVQAFWMAALGLLLLGRTRGGVPPAWRSGRAEPWPSTRGAGRVAPAGAGAEAAGGAGPAGSRRKRKRRT